MCISHFNYTYTLDEYNGEMAKTKKKYEWILVINNILKGFLQNIK